jgi:predicted GNAT family acetyltransferase
MTTTPQTCEGHGCAEHVEEVNVESWEETGKVLCADCVDAEFERRAESEDDE